MDETLKKSVRNGMYGLIPISIISFFFGGIYNEMIIGGSGITLENIVFSLFGSILLGIMVFILIFFLSLIYFYFEK